MDMNEEWDATQLTFTGMPEVMQMYLLIASGAADIPATRMSWTISRWSKRHG